jgi:crotonobetainyl-CoA:carnitine CoA-transferase CaiB-like acyl-CoA transferase
MRKTSMVTRGVLDGIRVVDLGTWRPAPFAGQLLA